MATDERRHPPEPEDEAVDLATEFGDRDETRVAEDEEDSPRERPLAVTDYGVTGAEERYDEPLSQRLRREAPDVRAGHRPVDPDRAAARGFSGRLVDGEDHAHVAEGDTGGFAAEEAAMHLMPEPRGGKRSRPAGTTADRLEMLEVQVAVLARVTKALVEAVDEMAVAEEGSPTEQPGERARKVRRAARDAHDLLLSLRESE